MDFLTFQDELQKKIMEQSSELDGEFQFEKVHKNNQVLHGVCYIPENSNAGMTFYAENMHKRYLNGESMDDIVQQFIMDVKEHEENMSFVQDAAYNWVQKENVVPALIGRKGNEEMLSGIPHVPFENLEIIFKVPIPELHGTANVTYPMMESFGLTTEELLETAKNNSVYKDAIQAVPMLEIMKELLGADAAPKEEPQGPGSKMIVITNADRYWGAAAILDKETMAAVSEKLGDDLYILPSSIHECIVVPKSDYKVSELKMMVQEINATQVALPEILSDEVYMFDSYTLEMKMAQDTREKAKDVFVPRPVMGMI